jgi:hypothetical protein
VCFPPCRGDRVYLWSPLGLRFLGRRYMWGGAGRGGPGRPHY